MGVKLFTEIGQLFAVIGVDHFQPQTAAYRKTVHAVEDHADTVGFGQVDERAPRPLAGENQLGKTQTAHQPLSAAFFGAHKFGAGTGRFGFGVAGHIEARGVLGDFRADFTLKTGAAVHKNGVH